MILRSQNVRNQGMFKIGACPKYNGTQQVSEDQAGSYLRCMNCGQMLEYQPQAKTSPARGRNQKKKARAA